MELHEYTTDQLLAEIKSRTGQWHPAWDNTLIPGEFLGPTRPVCSRCGMPINDVVHICLGQSTTAAG